MSPFDMALRYLSYRPRTVWEMVQYIRTKGFSEDIIKKTIQDLLDKQFLNDRDFAKLFIESKIKNKSKSKFAFQYELKKKGINPVIIKDILMAYNDQDLALKAVRPKIKIWKYLDDEKFKTKMMTFLNYRGFNYDISISTFNHFMGLIDTIKKEGNNGN